MTTEQMVKEFLANKAKLEALEKENAQLKASKPVPKLTAKISVKGGVSVYGLGRFPVTLYGSQWARLFQPEIMAQINSLIIAANKIADAEPVTAAV